MWTGGGISNGTTSFNDWGLAFAARCLASSALRWSWKVERRDWCVDEAELSGDDDKPVACCWLPIVCMRVRKIAFSSCNFLMSVASASMRLSAGCGIHWNMVARKLCNETSSVSCHAFEKQTANTGCSSGLLQNGKTVNDKRKLCWCSSASRKR